MATLVALPWIAKMIALPPGSISGHRNATSELHSGFRNSCGLPPAAETLQSPAFVPGRKMTESSGSQVAPKMLFTSHNVSGAPPPAGTFLSLWSEDRKPIHWPSGEKNGAEPPSV